jgi:hypothetical protein
MKLKSTPKEYQDYWHSTKNPMSWSEWQRIENDKKKDKSKIDRTSASYKSES